GRDIDLVEDVGFVWRYDGDAEHLAEADGEDEQPHQRPHQRRNKAFALVEEAQGFAPYNAVQAGEVLTERKAAPHWADGRRTHGAAIPESAAVPVRRMNAAW